MRRWLLAAILAGVAIVVGLRVATVRAAAQGTGLEVALVFDASAADAGGRGRAAYESVLREEGVPHRWLPAAELALLSGEELRRRYAAIVFPDGVARYLPQGTLDRTLDYVTRGGSVAVVFDAGVVDERSRYLREGVLGPLVGVRYGLYERLGAGAYPEGAIRFRAPELAGRWNIPPGKLWRGRVVGGYAYGSLTYPVARARPEVRGLEVAATDGNGSPVISVRELGEGRALWVGVPLGWLKGRSDDLPLRAILRTFLLERVGVPRLVPAPGGVGGLVISWHVDSNEEYEGIPRLIRAGLVRPGLRQEFDVTAGPDTYVPGDGAGVDACGRGTRLVRRLARYGEIGSHGGWVHNWFAEELNAGRLERAEVERMIHRNNACLERVTGTPVRSYAAPEGVHPPLVTHILERLGIRSYYYTGDTGSAPNRTFLGGEMVSGEAWAFPVMPNGRFASVGEMLVEGGLPASEVEDWLDATADYVVDERTIRLLYSHPYDLATRGYAAAYGRFLDRVEHQVARGRLSVRPMAEYASFLSRFVRTEATFELRGGDVAVSLANADGLYELAFAVPRSLLSPAVETPDGLTEIPGTEAERLFAVTAKTTSIQVTLAGVQVTPTG
ncbi:MAG: polysaccharide deacetylase family protein [Gaiellales bacterium]